MLNAEAVLFANEGFYLALRQGDVAAMSEIWAVDAPVCCLHPGWEPLFGRRAVLESWRAILESPPPVDCQDARVLALDQAATVICYEVIGKDVLAATNLFVQEGGRVRMVHHHAASTRGTPSGLPGTGGRPTLN